MVAKQMTWLQKVETYWGHTWIKVIIVNALNGLKEPDVKSKKVQKVAHQWDNGIKCKGLQVKTLRLESKLDLLHVLTGAIASGVYTYLNFS